MAITNREILLNQVKRINEKTNRNFVLHMTKTRYCLGEDCRSINLDKTTRNDLQMIEFLAGFEVAINNLQKPTRIYFVKCEVNDKGWHTGYHHFAKLEDAIKLMRNHVALQIWRAREDHKKVFLKVFGDSVMGDVSKNPQRSQNIFVRIDNDTFEYRVWSEELHYSELPKDKCFNY